MGSIILGTHAHYDGETFDTDREGLLGSPKDAGITSVMNVTVSLGSCMTTLKLAETYDWMYAAQGIHPSETAELDEREIRWIESCCAHEKIKAVGEIGLDYYWEKPDRSVQRKWFVRQLGLARRTKLPIIMHSRDAAKDTLGIMKAERAGDMGSVVHCFSYGKGIAREYLNMGFFLGIGGVVTSNNAKKLKEVVECAPLKSLVLETDCSYLAPVPNRGKHNSFLNLTHVMDIINRTEGVDRNTVMKTVWENTLRLYRIGPIPTSNV